MIAAGVKFVMEVRKYKRGEEKELWSLFHNTVHHINTQHYTPDQINAWAPDDLDLKISAQKIREIAPYVVVINDRIVAYGDIQENGYIDHFFCHHEYQRKGIGSFLFAKLEKVAVGAGINKISADVSITAKPFFESKGFSVEEEQLIKLRGQELTNYKMIWVLRHS